MPFIVSNLSSSQTYIYIKLRNMYLDETNSKCLKERNFKLNYNVSEIVFRRQLCSPQRHAKGIILWEDVFR